MWRKAIQHALGLEGNKRHVTLVHKGNIMKFTEGAFRDWGYELATSEFRDQCITERESWILGNLDQDPGLSAEANARLIEPGYDSPHPGEESGDRCGGGRGDRGDRRQPRRRQVETDGDGR